MKHFFVELELNIGEYQKSTRHLITAETREQAMLQAMADESHGCANMDSEDGIWWDMGGEMAYCVSRCDEVSDELVATLKTNRIFYGSTYDPDAILELISDDAGVRDIDTLLGYLD